MTCCVVVVCVWVSWCAHTHKDPPATVRHTLFLKRRWFREVESGSWIDVVMESGWIEESGMEGKMQRSLSPFLAVKVVA